jgi:hypothetical protein
MRQLGKAWKKTEFQNIRYGNTAVSRKSSESNYSVNFLMFTIPQRLGKYNNVNDSKNTDLLMSNTFFSHHQKMAGHSLVQSPEWRSDLLIGGLFDSNKVSRMYFCESLCVMTCKTGFAPPGYLWTGSYPSGDCYSTRPVLVSIRLNPDPSCQPSTL